MFIALRELLQSQDGMFDSEQISNFILKSRQMRGSICKSKAEEVLFFSFQKIGPIGRCQLIQDINQKINQKVGVLSSSTVSKIMLTNISHSLSSEEQLFIEKDYNFEFLSKIVKKMDPYEDIELSAEDVKQVFTELEKFIFKIEKPSPALMIFFNDFIIRSCLNQSYVWKAD